MQKITLAGLGLSFVNFSDILEYLQKGEAKNDDLLHLISLNAENFTLLFENPRFKKIVLSSQSLIADGASIRLAAKWLSGMLLERLTGVDTMEKLIEYAAERSFEVGFIGGRGDLAESVNKCYKEKYPHLKSFYYRAFSDKNNPKEAEIEGLKRIVSLTKPKLVFVSFGSPFQELWIEENRALFSDALLVMGVGGAFEFASGKVSRAPRWLQYFGFEWLYRLFRQPWRAKRQLTRLPKFVFLLVKHYLKHK